MRARGGALAGALLGALLGSLEFPGAEGGSVGGWGLGGGRALRLRGGAKGVHPRLDYPHWPADGPQPYWEEDGVKYMRSYEEFGGRKKGDGSEDAFDIQRGAIDLLNHNGGAERWVIDPEEGEMLMEQHKEMSEKVRMTQMFLLLQNVWLDAQLPGGLNCSYEMTWRLGQIWDNTKKTDKWTKSAWLQMERAENVDEMPPIWQTIMSKAWDDFQEFLAVLEEPDGGVHTELYQDVVQRWKDMQVAYMSNINDAFEITTRNNTLKKKVQERAARTQAIKEERMKVPHLWPMSYYLYKKAAFWWRDLMGVATEQEKLEQYRYIDVTGFGVPLFNTNQQISDRIWSYSLSQGESEYVAIWQAIAFISKRAEFGNVLPVLPMDDPTPFSGKHVLLNNTDYQKEYYRKATKKKKSTIDKRRYNALDRLVRFCKDKLTFLRYDDTSVWDRKKHKFEYEDILNPPGAEKKFSVYDQWCWPTYWTPQTEEKYLKDRCIDLMLGPYFDELEEEDIDITEEKERMEKRDEGAEMLENWLEGLLNKTTDKRILKDPKPGLHNATMYQAAGHIRACAKALGYNSYGAIKDWIDNPDVPKRIKQLVLVHPTIQQHIHEAQIWDPFKAPWCTIVDADGNAVPNQDDYRDLPDPVPDPATRNEDIGPDDLN